MPHAKTAPTANAGPDWPALLGLVRTYGFRLFLGAQLAAFTAVSLAIGALRAWSPETYFLADRYLPVWPAAVLTILLLSSGFAMSLAGRAARMGRGATVTLMLLLALFGGLVFTVGQIAGLAKLQHDLPWEMIVDLGDQRTMAPAFGAPSARTWESPTFEKSFLAPSSQAPTGMAGAYGNVEPAAPTRAAMRAAAVGVHRMFLVHAAVVAFHLVHVLIGLGIVAWLLVLSLSSSPGPRFSAVLHGTGSWWQLVSMTWIFLFALLYLIP